MSEKELLYLEDAFNHEKNIIEIYNSLQMECVEDFMSKELKRKITLLRVVFYILLSIS